MIALDVSKPGTALRTQLPPSWAGTVYFTHEDRYDTYIVQADTEQGAYDTLMGPMAMDTYLTDYLVRLS